MARVKNCSLAFANGSTYLLREGGSVTLRLTSGFADPYNQDTVVTSRITVWCPTGNVFVSEDGAGIRAITAGIPLPSKGPYQQGAERRTVVEYNAQPANHSVEFDVQVQGRPWAYSDEVLYVKVEMLKANGAVYADNGFEINGRKVYPHVKLRLATSAGRTEEPDAAENARVEPLGAKSVLVSWTTPVQATSTKIFYSTGGEGGAQTLVTAAGPVGNNAWFVHEGLTADTSYSYFLQCVNGEGDSGDPVYIGTAKTTELPAVPDAPVITSALTPNANTAVVTFDQSAEVALKNGRTAPNLYRIYGRIASFPDLPENYVTVLVDDGASSASVDWLNADETYAVYMTAVNDGGESAPTAQVQFTMPSAPANPAIPVNVQVATSGYNTQTITWEMDNPNVEGFGLYGSIDQTTWVPVQEFAPLPSTARSWVQTDLQFGTTYYWRVFSFNYVDGVLTYSDPAQASAATDDAPLQPNAVDGPYAFSTTNSNVTTWWNDGGGIALGYKVYRSTDDSTYTFIADIPAGVTFYRDYGLDANTVYYYRVDTVGYSGDVTGGTVACATLSSPQTIHPVSGFTMHEDSRNMILELSGRGVITSDRDRAVVRVGTNWYKAGIRPVRGSVGLAKTTGGALSNGVYRVYLVLARGETRSVPSPASAEVTINDTSNRLVVTPPLNGDGSGVECRDIGYDINGDEITGADAWEIYVAEETQDQAYMVARLPLEAEFWEDAPASGTFSIEAGLTTADLFDGTRRPMEQMLESSLPPAGWIWCSKDNRVFVTGEADLIPTAAETADGAELQIEAGDSFFTVTDWDASDACVYHRLVLDGIETGWEVYDYDHDAVFDERVTKCYIRHSDPTVNAGGFNGETGDYTDFKLMGNKSRVYLSAFFSGAALSQLVYSPETFPPMTVMDTEFFPEDNGAIECMVASGEGVLAGKAEKWIAVAGGDEADTPLLDTRVLSRGSGINAPISTAQDAYGNIYYLGDTGPFRVNYSGVEKVNIKFGGRRLFSEIFDISSIPNGKGAWFSREDWYVVTGLNLKGNVGNRDGLILDTRNGALLPFTTPYEMTHIKEYKNSAGEFQLLFGADDGKMGYLFKAGLYVDGADYTGTYAMAGAEPIVCRLRTGIVDTEHALTMRWVQPRVKARGGADFDLVLSLDGKRRTDNPNEFTAQAKARFSTATKADHVSLPGGRYNQVQFELEGATRVDSPGAWFEVNELPVRGVVRHAS